MSFFVLSFAADEDRAASWNVNLNYWNFMEQLNRIEIRGMVGSVRLQTFSDNVMARMTVATNHAYKDKDGSPVIETSWHNVVAWEGRGMPDFASIKKGSCVYVCGRLRISKFTGSDGDERRFYEVVATRVQIVNPDDLA